MKNSNEPTPTIIAQINGVNIYTDEQHLLHFVDMLPYPQYIDVYNISDKEALQSSYDMLDDYKNVLESLIDSIQNQIDIIDDEENE